MYMVASHTTHDGHDIHISVVIVVSQRVQLSSFQALATDAHSLLVIGILFHDVDATPAAMTLAGLTVEAFQISRSGGNFVPLSTSRQQPQRPQPPDWPDDETSPPRKCNQDTCILCVY